MSIFLPNIIHILEFISKKKAIGLTGSEVVFLEGEAAPSLCQDLHGRGTQSKGFGGEAAEAKRFPGWGKARAAGEEGEEGRERYGGRGLEPDCHLFFYFSLCRFPFSRHALSSFPERMVRLAVYLRGKIGRPRGPSNLNLCFGFLVSIF